MGRGLRIFAGLLGVLSVMLLAPPVFADRFTSSNFTIDSSAIGNSLGGSQSSTNYNLVSSGGESVIGNGASGSYKLGQGYVPTLDKSLQLATQPSSQVAYYPLDEDTGTAVWDTTTNNNHGSFVGSPTWTTGKVGGALSFANASDYVSVADNASFAVGSSPVTMSAWVNFDSGGIGSQTTVFSQNNDSFELTKTNTNKLRIEMKCSDDSLRRAQESGASLTSSGTWYHVAATFNPTNGAVALYVNGTSLGVTYVDAQAACVGGLKNSTSNLTIGSRGSGTLPMTGSIDEFKMYGRALTDREIKAEFEAGMLGNTAGISLNSVTPGVSQTANFDTVVQTDAPGYNLAINQNHNLQNGSNGVPIFSQDFNSFSDGTTLTTGNTGFDAFTVSGTATFTAATASPQHSTYGRIASTTSSTHAVREDHALSSSRYYRFYIRLASIPASTQTLFTLRDAANNAVSGIRIQSDGTFILRDGLVGVDTSTQALGANEWMRMELHYNAANSTQTLRLFFDGDADGSTPTQTLSGSATNGSTDDMQIGLITAQASQTMDVDEIEMSTVTWLGPPATASISAVSSSIASPVAWSEGTTKGLGFSLTAAPGLDGKWGSGANYAAFPLSGTTFYTRSGYSGGVKDVIAMRARVDVTTSQVASEYQNIVTITGTIVP